MIPSLSAKHAEQVRGCYNKKAEHEMAHYFGMPLDPYVITAVIVLEVGIDSFRLTPVSESYLLGYLLGSSTRYIWYLKVLRITPDHKPWMRIDSHRKKMGTFVVWIT